MSQRQVQDYLEDILEAVAAIEQFTAGIEYSNSQFGKKLFKPQECRYCNDI